MDKVAFGGQLSGIEKQIVTAGSAPEQSERSQRKAWGLAASATTTFP